VQKIANVCKNVAGCLKTNLNKIFRAHLLEVVCILVLYCSLHNCLYKYQNNERDVLMQ
jgi:hypothetical protein